MSGFFGYRKGVKMRINSHMGRTSLKKRQAFKEARRLANESDKAAFVNYDKEAEKFVVGFDRASGKLIGVGMVKPVSRCFESRTVV